MKTNKENNIDVFLSRLKAMNKRSKAALIRVEKQLQREDSRYKKELADFEKLYGVL